MLAEVFVTCPDCGYRALLDHGDVHHFVQIGRRCKHRQNPEKCPSLAPALAKAREALDWVEG